MANKKTKKLYRVEGNEAILFGVCGGMAEYFSVDPTVMRVLWALLSLAYGLGIIAYIVCAFIMPPKSSIK